MGELDDARVAQIVGEDNDARAADERPLLRSFPNPSGYGSQQHLIFKPQESSETEKLKHYLNSDIDARWTDLILIIGFFLSGCIDAGAYNAYECFSSMQTGNTIFAALGVSDLPLSSPTLAWTKSVCAITSYILGSLATGTFHRSFGAKKRWVMFSSFTFQAVLIFISAVLVKIGHSSGSPESGEPSAEVPWIDLIPIGLLSFQAAGKVIASRVLQFTGLPCIVLTTLYTDLISDPSLLSAGLWSNPARNRKASAAVLYFSGAVVGGVAASTRIGFSGGLFIAAGIQLSMAAMWLVWRDESNGEDDHEED